MSWPSGAHVRVDRLDAEARDCIERSARFAAAVGSPVLTIHLFTPVDPDQYRAGFVPADHDDRALPSLLRRDLPRPRSQAADRERAAGAANAGRGDLPVADRWPLARPAAVARAGSRAGVHDRRLARGAVPLLRRCVPDPVRARTPRDDLELERFVEELGPGCGGRPRLRRTRPARRGSPLRCRASSISIRSSAVSASSCRSSSPRSTSPTAPRSREMKAGTVRSSERCARRGRAAASDASPPGERGVRLAGRARAPRPDPVAARAAGDARWARACW